MTRGLRPAARPLGLRMGLLLGLPLMANAAQAQDLGSAQTAPLPFVAVEADGFNKAGALSNAWADFDRDGDLDLAVSWKGGEVRLYRNDAGQLINQGTALGLPESGPEIRGLSWGDYDGDGYVDLLGGTNLTEDRSQNRSFIWHNQAGQGFADKASELGLLIPGRISRQANWIDYDGDGQLDLYASDRAGPNQLLRQSDGHFAPAFAQGGINDVRATVGACWLDYDRDGDLDLFLANQSGSTDALWRNDGDSFVDVAPELGLDQAGRDRSTGGVGCAVGDYDNDGNLDLFVAVYGTDLLYRNTGDGRFEEVAEQAGLAHGGHAVAAAWGDYDNDGWLDLFVTHYEGPAGQQIPANLLYRNLGNGRFEQILSANSLLNAGDHGVEWIDYDQDGALDLSLTDGYGPEGGHFLFKNSLDEARRSHSLSLDLRNAKGSPLPGAEIRYYKTDGVLLGSRQVSTGGGYNAQSATPVHFGLSELQTLKIVISYGGKTQVIQDISPQDHRGTPLKLVFEP